MARAAGETASEPCEYCGGELERREGADVYQCRDCERPVSAMFL